MKDFYKPKTICNRIGLIGQIVTRHAVSKQTKRINCRDVRLECPNEQSESKSACRVRSDPNGVTRSSNRSVIPELAEGSPADKRSHSSPPTDPNDPNGVAQPHKYKNSPKNKKFRLLGRTFFNSKTSHNALIIKIIQIISCL